MSQSIIKAAGNPKSVTQGKSGSEGLLSYFTSRASWAAMAAAAVAVGAGGVYMVYDYLTSSNTVSNARDTFGEWA